MATNSQVISPRLSFLSVTEDCLVIVIFSPCLNFQKQGGSLFISMEEDPMNLPKAFWQPVRYSLSTEEEWSIQKET